MGFHVGDGGHYRSQNAVQRDDAETVRCHVAARSSLRFVGAEGFEPDSLPDQPLSWACQNLEHFLGTPEQLVEPNDRNTVQTLPQPLEAASLGTGV